MVRISPEGEGNFMAKWGVETTAPRVFGEGWPRRMLYDVGALTMRMVLVWVPSRKTVWRSM